MQKIRLNSEQINALKQRELEIFREFISVCERLGVTYYVIGGTLLGAVRHSGFIPWDDDIDVGMLRSDYEIFLREAQALLPKHLFLQTVYTDQGCVFPYAKIRDGGTAFIEASAAHIKMHHGVFIDVFPLDYYPTGAEQKGFARRLKAYDCRIAATFRCERTLMQKCKQLLLRIAYPSLRSTVLRRDALYKSVGESELIANLGGAWGEREIVPAEWYGDGRRLSFEGIEVNAPSEYGRWLTNVYGDYMQLPPAEKRISHHDLSVFDLENSYLKYTEE